MRQLRSVLVEALVLLALGFAFALAANAVSPRGLSLSRDYFARAASDPARSPVAPTPSNSIPAVATDSSSARAQIEANGIAVLELAEVESLFRDPAYEQEAIVFIDARNDRQFEEGHIPGAYQFDRYYPEKYFPNVLPACMSASRIVVYCTGGKCEDSEFAALTLIDAGIPADRIAVFLGGISDWAAHGKPIETGARKSGLLRAPAP